MQAARNDFFEAPTIAVAQKLIGSSLIRRLPADEPDSDVVLAGRIVETEAYLPLVDPSCHGYRGPTKRNACIFGRPGFAYVYFIYGNHYCLNVTTEPAGIGGAVLIRAVEPMRGVEEMRRRRRTETNIAALACGPGNLCRAMSIDLSCNGVDLRQGDLVIAVTRDVPQTVARSGRIGLNTASDWPLRFFDPSSPCVSPFRKRLNSGLKIADE